MSGGYGEFKDFYSLMGLKSDYTSSELRDAYKKLAMVSFVTPFMASFFSFLPSISSFFYRIFLGIEYLYLL
jgi:hypothetical protein